MRNATWMTAAATVALMTACSGGSSSSSAPTQAVAPAASDVNVALADASGSSEVRMPVRMTLGDQVSAAAAQFNVSFDDSALELVDVETGATAQTAGKQVSFNVQNPGQAKVLVVGFNRNEIADGVVAELVFRVRNANAGKTTVSLDAVKGSTADAQSLPGAGASATVTIQ